MNMQAMMQQAQKLQKDIEKIKKEIENKEFSVTKSFVEVKMMGNKKLTSIKILMEEIEKDNVEITEDLILVAVNELQETIDREMGQNMAKFGPGINNLL